MSRHYFFAAVAACCLLVPLVALGAVIQTGDNIAITQPADDDIYAFGRNISIVQPVNGDVVAAGEQVQIEELVDGDVAAAGNTIALEGSVNDDVRLVGSQISITGSSIGDDLFAAGESVTVDNSTTVEGDTRLAGRTIVLHGQFNGTVYVAAENVNLASDAVVRGDFVSYGAEPSFAEGGRVEGSVRHREPEERRQPNPISRWVLGVLTWFVVGFIFVKVAPQHTAHLYTIARSARTSSALLGIGWVLAWLPVTLLLAVTFIGLPLAFLLLLTTLLLGVAAIGYTAVFLGVWVLNMLTKAEKTESITITWQHILLGAVVYKALQLVPIVGWLTAAVLTIYVFGALLVCTWRTVRT